jgi:hypothetical protein
MNSIASSCYGVDINVWYYGTVCDTATYCKQALGVFAIIVNRALSVDRDFVWLVAHRVHLRDTVNARFGSGAGWKWRCGFGARGRRRGGGWLGGWCIIGGTQIWESEKRGQESDLQAFAVRDVKPVAFNRLQITQTLGRREKDVPIKIVIQDLNGRGLGGLRLNLFRDRDKDSWIWLPDKVARFPFPLECVSESTR